jgi:hypothetical protein
MTEVTIGQFARLAALHIAAGLFIGLGWAWIVSTPVFTVSYTPQQTIQDVVNASTGMQQVATVTPVHLTMVQGLEILIVLFICGVVLGVAARKVQEWNRRRLEEQEATK